MVLFRCGRLYGDRLDPMGRKVVLSGAGRRHANKYTDAGWVYSRWERCPRVVKNVSRDVTVRTITRNITVHTPPESGVLRTVTRLSLIHIFGGEVWERETEVWPADTWHLHEIYGRDGRSKTDTQVWPECGDYFFDHHSWLRGGEPVSYTHLDVYKRQDWHGPYREGPGEAAGL